MFYQARYYDPLTARFISADTIVPEPGNPQDFNRYSYVRNNPLGYTDPSGNCATRNGTIIDDASTDPCSPPGVRWVSLAEGLGYTGDGMPTCNMVPGLYQCTIDSNPGDPSLGNLVFGLIALGFNLSPLGVLTDMNECSQGNNVSCGFVGLEFFSGLGPLKRLLKNFKYVDDFFDLGRAADKVADTASAARRGADSVDGVLAGLRAGRSPGVKLVDTVDELDDVFRRLAVDGAPVSGTTYPGRMVRLPDGTTVGIRPFSTSGGPTIDIKLPDGNLQRVHVDL